MTWTIKTSSNSKLHKLIPVEGEKCDTYKNTARCSHKTPTYRLKLSTLLLYELHSHLLITYTWLLLTLSLYNYQLNTISYLSESYALT